MFFLKVDDNKETKRLWYTNVLSHKFSWLHIACARFLDIVSAIHWIVLESYGKGMKHGVAEFHILKNTAT